MIDAPQLDFTAVAPLLVLAFGAFAVLVVELILRGRERFIGRRVTPEWVGALLALLTSAVLVVAGIVTAQNFVTGETHVFNAARPLVTFDRFASLAATIVCGAALLSTLQAYAYLVKRGLCRGEYFCLVLLSVAGMVLLVCSADLVATFLAVELLSMPLYVLSGFDRAQLRSNEAALKYFITGSFASALLLYGMALLYGVTGATHYDAIREALDPGSPLAMIGVGLVLVGFAFKIASVPFHQWVPDVYEGAPTAVTAFMSVTVKAAAFCALLRIVGHALTPVAGALLVPLLALAAATLVVGNVMALAQDRVKRLLAWSSIAHVGVLLVGVAAGGERGTAAVVFYLAVYGFMNLGAFGVVMALAGRGGEADRITDFDGLAQEKPVLAALMTLFMLSLTGIPGTAGFIAKFQIFMAAVESEHVELAVLVALTSLVSAAYYLRLPVAMYMRPRMTGERRPSAAGAEVVVLAVCAAAVLLLGFLPNGSDSVFPFLKSLDWARDSVAIFADAGRR